MAHASTNRISEQASNWSESASEAGGAALASARESIVNYPGTAVLSAFGVGLGIGVGLALVLGSRPAPPMDYGLRDKLTAFVNEHMPWMRG